MRCPNPIKVAESSRIIDILHPVLGLKTGRTRTIKYPVYLTAKKDKKTIERYKKLRSWLDRAIQYGEQE